MNENMTKIVHYKNKRIEDENPEVLRVYLIVLIQSIYERNLRVHVQLCNLEKQDKENFRTHIQHFFSFRQKCLLEK